MTKCYFPFPENQRPHRRRKLHTTFWAMLAMLIITSSCQTKAQPFSSALEIGSADLDGAISVFVGDVNGDGDNDVIVASIIDDNRAPCAKATLEVEKEVARSRLEPSSTFVEAQQTPSGPPTG